MNFTAVPQPLAVCRLAHDAEIPTIALNQSFFAITRTTDELSLVLPLDVVDPSWQVEKTWRGLKIEGPLDFSMVGIIAKISAPLAAAGIPIFVISTFDTDYLLVKEEKYNQAIAVLQKEKHRIQ